MVGRRPFFQVLLRVCFLCVRLRVYALCERCVCVVRVLCLYNVCLFCLCVLCMCVVCAVCVCAVCACIVCVRCVNVVCFGVRGTITFADIVVPAGTGQYHNVVVGCKSYPLVLRITVGSIG